MTRLVLQSGKVLLSLLAISCEGGSVVGTEKSGVVLVVPVDPATFADGENLNVSVWNQGQLEALERNGQCATVVDPVTNVQRIHCPDGIEYEEVTPEAFEFPLQQTRVEVPVTHVNVGETFRIRISGLNQDGCNHTFAGFTGVASSEHLVLDGLEWETTLRACPPS